MLHTFESLRIGRIFMLTFITASTAWGFGATPRNTALAGACAAFLSLGGFFLDHLFDTASDRLGGKLSNPFATGLLSIRQGTIIVCTGFLTAAAFASIFNPWALLPQIGVLLILVGQAQGVLDTPFPRAFALGGLQALYVVLGGQFAHAHGMGLMATALFLFFAMSGGRAIGDVRDLPHDLKTGVTTIPKQFGIRFTVIFLFANEFVAYLCGLAVYWTGALDGGYLACIVAIIIAGTAINILFAVRPTPPIAKLCNTLSLSLLGSLYAVGMILGRGITP
jgi:4-hydroxybenzoate polyprenyltransferase